MTDSAGKTFDPSLIRTVTLRRLSVQLEKMEKGRRRSIGHPDLPGPDLPRPDLRPTEFKPLDLPEKILTSGIAALDRLLPDAGFREGTLVEWLAEAGSGDQLALLAASPALGNDRFLFVIDSEKTFYPPAAAALGIDLKRLILVRPGKKIACPRPQKNGTPKIEAREIKTPKTKTPGKNSLREETSTETLWALEQTLQSRGVAVTFCRLERINAQVFRRLQLAAERGGGLGFLIRAPAARKEPSWSDVRLGVEPVPIEPVRGNFSPSGRRWRVEVLRCRRGAAGQRSILLEYDDATHTVYSAGESPPAVLPKRAPA